jgi:AcrR family transcriptional regulator
MTESASSTTRRLRSDGQRTRERILVAAAQLATVEGIDGLSIGRLADHLGMSKSGLFAHFGSKEELQLSAIAQAEKVFEEDVLAPALAQPPGLARLRALCDGFLSHVARRVFPGGCFFASVGAELDTRPGPVRDRVVGVAQDWLDLLVAGVVDAQAAGELDPSLEPEQLAFELDALLALGNSLFLLRGDEAIERAQRGLADRLERARSPRPDIAVA